MRTAGSIATIGHLTAIATGPFGGDGSEASEGVLHAYSRAGIEGLAQSRDGHAYVLWDALRRELVVGCDAMGLSALAYVWDGRAFVVCSRALPLLRLQRGWRCWNDIYLAHVLSGLWAPAASTTAFRGVSRMLGGEILRVSARGLERLRGDTLDFQRKGNLHHEPAVEELGQRIDRAVREQLRRPGRACVALSGGLDSCVVASAVARCTPPFDAFRLIAREASAPAPLSRQAVFPAMREHWVAVPGAAGGDENLPLADDAIAAGPALQPARLALLRAVRDAGFDRILDGEGGDELFDLAWRLGDLGEERISLTTVRVLLRRSSRARFLRDLLVRGTLGGISSEWLRRQRGRMAARRPWLTRSFWQDYALGAAWEEAIAFARTGHPRDRLAQILEAHARYRAVQTLARDKFGIEGVSPLLDRDVVEFVGALPARLAVEPGHAKGLLRRVAATRLPAAIAWRPKQEPLYEWLATRAICDEARVDRIAHAIATSALLRESVDPLAIHAAINAVRRSPERTTSMATALDQLFCFVEWSVAVHAQYGV